MNMKPILSTPELAELLHCGDEQVELLARAGTLPGVKLGRVWVFPFDAVLAALNEKATADARRRRGEEDKTTSSGTVGEQRVPGTRDRPVSTMPLPALPEPIRRRRRHG